MGLFASSTTILVTPLMTFDTFEKATFMVCSTIIREIYIPKIINFKCFNYAILPSPQLQKQFLQTRISRQSSIGALTTGFDIKFRKKEKITIKRWWKIQINNMYYKKWIKWKCMYICVCVIYVHVNVFVCMLECAVLMMVFMCNVEICRFILLVVGVL